MSKQTFRVLIVDNDADRRADIENILRADDLFTVNTVADIEEAWKSVMQTESPYHIALINDGLSALDKKHTSTSISLAEKIISNLPGIEIIVLANESNGDSTAAVELNDSRLHFLTGPITPAEAADSVRHIAESFQARDGAIYGDLLNILSDTSIALLNELNRQEMLETVVRAIQSIGFDHVGLYLLSEDGKKLLGVAHAGFGDDFIGSEWLVRDEAWHTLRPDSHSRLFTSELSPPLLLGRPPGTESVEEWVYLPLFRQGKFIGVLSMDNSNSRQTIRENVLNVLPLFAFQLAPAIEKGHLEELETRARNLQSILQIYTHINSPFNLEQALRAACQAAVQMLNVNHSWLMLFDVKSRRTKILAEYPKRGATGQHFTASCMEDDEKLISLKEPFVINDVETDAPPGETRRLLLKLNVRSAMLVPVINNNELCVSMCLTTNGSQRTFTKDDAALCKVLATQVAIAFDNAQLYLNTKQRADKLEELQRTAQDFARSRTRTELLKTIIKHAVTLLDAKGGGVYQSLPEHDELVIVADSNNPQNVGKSLKVGEGMAGRLVQSGDAYMIVDSYDEWPGKSQTYTERGFGAVMEVPLKWHETIIGILYVEDHLGRKFREDDANLLSLFAGQAAIALANADLIARDEEKFQRLEKMSKVTKEIMSDLGSKTLDDELNLIAKHATEILDAEVCGVMLVQHEGFLSLVASYGHREGGFQKGRQFAIRCEPKGGLTGCIAWQGKLFNMHGQDLLNHFAVRNLEPDCTVSGICTALLAIPLKKRVGQEEKLLGLLRIGNKKGVSGELGERLGFTEEDEHILSIFAESVIIAIENSELVQQLKEQRDNLKEQKDQLVRLLDSSPNGIIAIDRQGRITRHNELAKELLGYYSDQEFAQLSVSQLYYDPLEPRRIGKQMHESASSNIVGYETFLRSKDDRVIPIRISATWLYDAKKERIGSVGYFEDLRSIQQSEKQSGLLLKMSRIVAQDDNLSRGLQSLTQLAVPLLANSFCRILLFDESRACLKVEAAYPVSREDGSLNWKHGRGRSLEASEYGGVQQLLKIKEPVTFNWNEKDAQPNLKGLTSHLGLGKNIQSLFLVPLVTEGDVIGVMEVGEMRSEKRNALSPDKLAIATDVAAQASIFVKRIRLHENAERRSRLLATLDEKSRYLRGEKDLTKLRHEFVRLAVELVGGAGGALFRNHPKLRETELSVIYELPMSAGGVFQHGKGLIGLAARTQETQVQLNYTRDGEREDLSLPFDFKTVVAVPLKYAGEVTDVLLVAGPEGKFGVTSAEVETLERFAAQASLAMQTSQQMNTSDLFKHLHVLHQISEYVLVESELDKVLDAVLTGITAGYGLGFNRAALFLLNERGEYLEGSRGIGQVDKAKAETDWSKDIQQGLYDLKSYLRMLENNPEPTTPIGQQIGSVRLPLKRGADDIFSRVISSKKEARVKAEELNSLPQRFNELFKPETEVVVVPIAARDKVMGLLIVDNKFTQTPISPADIESLITFVNTAAIAIDNHSLFQGMELGREQLSALFKASNALTSANKRRLILEEIVERTREAANAAEVIVILVDEAGRAHNVVHSMTDASYDIEGAIRPDGIAVKVMSTGMPQVIENSNTYPGIINPMLLQGQSSPTAFLCLPLRMQGNDFGVMWIKYDEPRFFMGGEIDALKLYVNQVAIAYDNARRIEELEHMRQAAEALASTTDNTKAVLVQIVESAKKVLQADSTVIYYYDSKSKSFILENWVGSNIPPEVRKEFAKTEPREGGTAYTVMQHKWIGVRDVDDVERYKFLGWSTRRMLERIGVQSFLGISLTVGDEDLGVLYVNYNRPRSFSEEEEETARTFANHAALALKKAKLLEEVRRAKKAAEAMAKVTVLGDRDATLDLITKETMAALDCDAVVLFEYDKLLQKLHHPPRMAGVIDEQRAASFDEVKRDSIVYYILDMDEPVVVEDVAESELFNNKRFARDEGIKSCFAAPLRAGRQQVGVLFINYRSKHHFTPEEVDNITLFANQAAIAIGNAQLFDNRQKQIEKQEALGTLSRALLSTIDLQKTMDRAVDVASRTLDVPYCCIMLPAGDEELVFSSAYGWEKEMVGNFRLKSGKRSQTGYTMEIMKPVPVDNYDDDQLFQIPPIVQERNILSGLSVPMFSGDKVIGVMVVHSESSRHWTQEEIELLSLIANQTAIAMQSAQQYQRSLRKSAYLKALYEAGQTITTTFGPESSELERRSILEKLLEHAVRSLASIAGDSKVLGTLKRYDAEADILTFEGVYPPDKYPALIAALGETRSPKKSWENGEKIGITGRAILEGRSQVTIDVFKDPEYIESSPGTKSQITIPLKDQGEIIGVLNLESEEQLLSFDDEDLDNLVALGELAVIIIQRAKLYEDLKKTKGLVGARTALAWMGMVYSAWRHTIEGCAVNIRNTASMMRGDLKKWRINSARQEHLQGRLDTITDQANKIIEKKSIPPLASEDKVETIAINELVSERIQQLWQNEPDNMPEFRLDLGDEDLMVRLSPGWFRLALDILVDNAVEAMAGRSKQVLTIACRSHEGQAEITISDTGKGMPREVFERVFKEKIDKPEGEQGFGIGLLMVQAILQAYNGNIILKESTENVGTSFVITFPLDG
jgi:PAS domain S-box-containing protein